MDDMTISGPKRLGKFARLAARFVEGEGFTVKQGPKDKLMLQNESQGITNLGVNFTLSVPRKKRQEVLGDAVQNLKAGVPLDDSTIGKLRWVSSANPRVGTRLLSAARKRQKSSRGEGGWRIL